MTDLTKLTVFDIARINSAVVNLRTTSGRDTNARSVLDDYGLDEKTAARIIKRRNLRTRRAAGARPFL